MYIDAPLPSTPLGNGAYCDSKANRKIDWIVAAVLPVFNTEHFQKLHFLLNTNISAFFLSVAHKSCFCEQFSFSSIL